ncbi:Z1 domain-containing protein [Rubripirellula sp.]|nr:Z1 domain-containing protein [Rubripirellula sp.]MDB4634104.1 Z1 domain-containing protein [Rubripirellula sp.]
MKNSIFKRLISEIASKLRNFQELGTPITNPLIEERIDELAREYNAATNFEISDEDVKKLKFQIGSMFNIKVGEQAVVLRNPDLPPWFDAKKTEINWVHWGAYRSMLESKGRPVAIVDANEEVIDNILDLSGDPTTLGSWSRKGLVMGNVQSGKTQNYIGLINKAIDCGYKTIILLGGHLNDLRRQTQERVDEGVLGKESRHLAETKVGGQKKIGVGEFHEEHINIHSGTTTIGDFNKSSANKLGISLTGSDPVVFTIKKNTGVLDNLFTWIDTSYNLNGSKKEPDRPSEKLDGPLLLIDDEADYASINTKHHKEEVTQTNACIRKLLSLFHRNTYVAYTATPFANIFIDPDDNEYTAEDDLFPSDFMVKIPVPQDYLGQDFYFRQRDARELEDGESPSNDSPTIAIKDYSSIYQLKKSESVTTIPESLKEAVRAFLLVIAIRNLRGDKFSHNTMLVNISHLKVHQNQLEHLLASYHKDISNALDAYSGLGPAVASESELIGDIEKTFEKVFSVEEKYEQIFGKLKESSHRVKVWAINQSNSKDQRDLDYSKHSEHGLCAIVIGGHKLSRGLTLEGLSISYFARNSKAYDTLMQMCRWFGYRPNYSDLCRVYLPGLSIDWYSFISTAINELYRELDLMSKSHGRPKDFGLKVREHSGAMIITAKNKIGWAESETRSQDLWGQVQRRFRFRREPEANKRNLEYTKQFLKKLIDDRGGLGNVEFDEKSRAIRISDVDYSALIEFIQQIDLPQDDLGNLALENQLKKMHQAGLAKPKVVLFNQVTSRYMTWENELNEAEKVFLASKYELLPNINVQLAKRRMHDDVGNSVYKVRSVHLGNKDDEKLFLTSASQECVKQCAEDPISFDYLCSEDRDFPGLLIYLFAVAVGPDKKFKDFSANDTVKLGHGQNPTVGYTVSFPRSDKLKGKSQEEIKKIIKDTKQSYMVDKVYKRNKDLGAYIDEIEDDE